MKFSVISWIVLATISTYVEAGMDSFDNNFSMGVITLDNINSDRATMEEIKGRLKRSGSDSGDILGLIKHKLISGVHSKLSAIAGASGTLSQASSGGKHLDHHDYHEHDHHEYHNHDSYGHSHPHHEEDKFDFWSLKKSVLNTLLQAAKALKGGLIAVKGKLIKGSGYVVSAKGKLIQAKGEAISSLGKHIAQSALLSPPKKTHHHLSSYSSPSVHGAYSAPSAQATAPDHGYKPAEYESSGSGGHSSDSGPHDTYNSHDSYNVPTGPGGTGYGSSGSHVDYPPSSHGEYGAPSSVNSQYGAPSASASNINQQKFNGVLEDLQKNLPKGTHAGIVILKKIPKGGVDLPHSGLIMHDLHTGPDRPKHNQVPEFKPLKHRLKLKDQHHETPRQKKTGPDNHALRLHLNPPAPSHDSEYHNHHNHDSEKHREPTPIHEDQNNAPKQETKPPSSYDVDYNPPSSSTLFKPAATKGPSSPEGSVQGHQSNPHSLLGLNQHFTSQLLSPNLGYPPIDLTKGSNLFGGANLHPTTFYNTASNPSFNAFAQPAQDFSNLPGLSFLPNTSGLDILKSVSYQFPPFLTKT